MGPDALFQRLDRELWDATHHNPVRVLGCIKQARLDAVAEDEGFLSHMARVVHQFEEYQRAPGWFEKHHPDDTMRIAYFSAEYGLTDSVPVYFGLGQAEKLARAFSHLIKLCGGQKDLF